MKYALAVTASPAQLGHGSAMRFIKALISAGHEIEQVFFYQDAVHIGNSLTVYPQDETNTLQQWQSLAASENIELVICIAAAIRRGVLDNTEQNRYEKPAHNLAEHFSVAGLGSWVEQMDKADRVMVFG